MFDASWTKNIVSHVAFTRSPISYELDFTIMQTPHSLYCPRRNKEKKCKVENLVRSDNIHLGVVNRVSTTLSIPSSASVRLYYRYWNLGAYIIPNVFDLVSYSYITCIEYNGLDVTLSTSICIAAKTSPTIRKHFVKCLLLSSTFGRHLVLQEAASQTLFTSL